METNNTLPPKCETPSNPQMFDRKKSFSSSYINTRTGALTLLDSLPKAPLHRRSASDPLALPKKSDLILIKPSLSDKVTSEGDLGSCSNNYFTKVQEIDDIEISENSLSPLAENPSSGDDAQLCQDSSYKTAAQKLGFDPNMDPKKIKRMLANRESAQRSRLRKIEYIEKLKRVIQVEEAKVSLMSPQVSYYELQRMILEKENYEMKQKLKALENEQALKEADYEALKVERDALSVVYMLLHEGK